MQITFAKHFVDPGERTYKPGDIVEFPDDRAVVLVHHGLATFTHADPTLAAHLPAPVETASGRRRKRETR